MSSSDSDSASAKSSAGLPRRSRSVQRWAVIIGSLSLLLVGFFILRFGGHVEGEEFAPSHFQSRRFSFYEIPFLRLQITPIRRRSSTPESAMHVRQTGLVPPVQGSPTKWHLVSISRGVRQTRPADADLLMSHLNLRRQGDVYWKRWTKDHPDLAQVLWPTVQRLAVRELYVLVPEVFELAQLEQTPTELQDRLDEYLQDQYYRLIQDMRAAEQPEIADALLQEALQDFPDNERLAGLQLAAKGTAGSEHER